MKTAFLLFVFLLLSLTVKAQEFSDTQKQYLASENILKNPGFEAGRTGWVNTAGTFTADSAIEFKGKYSGKIVLSAQTMSLTQSSTVNAAQYADGVQGLASVRIKSNIALQACSIQAGTVSTTNCVTTNTDSKWGLYKIPFTLGATSNGISIASTGSVSGTVYVDDAFVGAVDLKADISGVRKIGSIKFTGCAGNWSNGSTTLATMGVNTGCTYTTTGQVSAPTTMVAGFRILGRQAGSYKVDTYGRFGKNITTTNSVATFVVRDTTNSLSSYENSFEVSPSVGASLSSGYVGGSLDYTTSGDTSYEIFGKTSVTASSTLDVIYGNGTELSFDVYYYPPLSSQVYTSNNADFGPIPFTPTGSWTGNTTYTGNYSRQGKYAYISYTVATSAAPTPSATILTLNMPAGLVIDTSLINSSGSLELSQGIVLDGATAEYSLERAVYTSSTAFKLSMVKTVSGLNPVFLQYAADITNTAPITFGATDNINVIVKVPIVGWNQSNIIIGSFNEVNVSPGISKPKTCHYAFGGASATLTAPVVCSTGTCVEAYDSCNAVTPPAFSSTGVYLSTTFANGTFAANSFVQCGCVSYAATTGGQIDCVPYWSAGAFGWVTNSSGGIVISNYTTTPAGAATNSFVGMTCSGSAP